MDNDTVQKQKIKNLGNYLGIALVLASIVFVGHEFWLNSDDLGSVSFSSERLYWLLFPPVGYAIGLLSVILAWRQALSFFNGKRSSVCEIFVIYARSQIVKYLPGNVFHLAGRHYLGKKIGLEHGTLVGAAFYEIIGLILCGVIVAAATIDYKGIVVDLSLFRGFSTLFLFILFFGLIYRVVMTSVRKSRQGGACNLSSRWYFFEKLIETFFLYTFFFCIAGLSFAALFYCLGQPMGWSNLKCVIAAFAASWLAGFVTPGAPAGAGVREAVAMTLLGDCFPQSFSLIAILLFRVNTLFVDLMLFVSGVVAEKVRSGGCHLRE